MTRLPDNDGDMNSQTLRAKFEQLTSDSAALITAPESRDQEIKSESFAADPVGCELKFLCWLRMIGLNLEGGYSKRAYGRAYEVV
jgi:hypothetical protein